MAVAKRHGRNFKTFQIHNTARSPIHPEPDCSILEYLAAGYLNPFAFEICTPRVKTRNRKALSHVILGCE